jgi:hypothetical protein
MISLDRFSNIQKTMTELIYEAVTPEYGWGKYGKFRVLIRRKDGYINSTKLCKDGGKELFHYMENKCSKELIECVVSSIDTSRDKIIQKIMIGPNDLRGTYVHQDLIPHIASWVSSRFAVQISIILRQWRALSAENEFTYWSSLGECVVKYPSCSNQEERKWQELVASQENGQMEVITRCGRIDVLSDLKIIEVKRACEWKHDLGQLYAYSLEYPNHARIICLFDCSDDFDKEMIVSTCKTLDVAIEFLDI